MTCYKITLTCIVFYTSFEALVARAQQIFAVVPMLKEGTLFVYCTYGISHNDFCLCAVGTHTIRCQVVDKTLNCSLLGFDVWLVGAKGFNIVVYVLYGFYLFVLTSQSFRHYCSLAILRVPFYCGQRPDYWRSHCFYVGSP